jgi:transcriptional regulator with XRE-family HTH domain
MNMPEICPYGPVLGKIRREKCIKAANVARRLGFSSATYSQIETGQRSASLERIAGICAELGVSMKQFLDTWQQQAERSDEKSNVENNVERVM